MISSSDWRGAAEATRRRWANRPASSFWVSGEESRNALAASGSTRIVMGSGSICLSIHRVGSSPFDITNPLLFRFVRALDVVPAPAIPGADRGVRPPAVRDLLPRASGGAQALFSDSQ